MLVFSSHLLEYIDIIRFAHFLTAFADLYLTQIPSELRFKSTGYEWRPLQRFLFLEEFAMLVRVVWCFWFTFLVSDVLHASGIKLAQNSQVERIRQGKSSGELTRGEFRKLRKGQRHLRDQRVEAKADGDVTKRERRKLQKMKHKQNKSIYKKKHNENKRGDAREEANRPKWDKASMQERKEKRMQRRHDYRENKKSERMDRRQERREYRGDHKKLQHIDRRQDRRDQRRDGRSIRRERASDDTSQMIENGVEEDFAQPISDSVDASVGNSVDAEQPGNLDDF